MDSMFFDSSDPNAGGVGVGVGVGVPAGLGIPTHLNMNSNMNVTMEDWAGQPPVTASASSSSAAAAAQRFTQTVQAAPVAASASASASRGPLGPSTSASDLGFFVDPVSPSPFAADPAGMGMGMGMGMAHLLGDSAFNTNQLSDLGDSSMGLDMGLGMGLGNFNNASYGVNEPSRKRPRSDYVDVTAGYGNYMGGNTNQVFSANALQQQAQPNKNEYALQPVNSQRQGDYVVPADDQFSLSSLMTFHNAQQKIDQYMHMYNGAPAPNQGPNSTGSTFGNPLTGNNQNPNTPTPKTEPQTPVTQGQGQPPAAARGGTKATSARGGGRKSTSSAAASVAAAAAAAAASGMDHDSGKPSPNDDDDDDDDDGHGRSSDDGRKKKHRMTDRQRRAKIKEGMDQLKALVPLDTSQKADQATIVASSVQLVHSLKDEIAALKAKLENIEAKDKDQEARREEMSANFNFFNMGKNRVGQGPASLVSPFASLMASLNGAGVAMWRLGLDGRLLEVNMVFEMISGFHSAEIVGKSPCAPPLRGTLSCIPSQYLRSFATLDAFTTHGGAGGNTSTPQTPGTPGQQHSTGSGSTPGGSVASPTGTDGTPTSPIPNEGQGALFGGANMHSLPHLPDSALRSFFPSKIQHCEPDHISLPERVPSMHGVYLIHHLLNLPNNNVLKLLSRHATSYGDTLESIVTLCLVRGGPDGAPQYILSMNTPDSRRLLKTTRTATL